MASVQAANKKPHAEIASAELANRSKGTGERCLLSARFSPRTIGNEEEVMERRAFLGAPAAASFGVALDGALAEIARAQKTPRDAATSTGRAAKSSDFPENSTIVLVHAAWADGYCWSNIVVPLKRHGLNVMCAPIPLTSFTDDIDALSRALEHTSGPLVLVGHAYSGAVIAAVKEERVKSLVYIAALAPDEGETVEKVFYREAPGPEAPKMVPDSHGFVWMPDDAFHNALAQKASLDQAKIAASVQRPLSVRCIKQPSPSPLWRSKPSWYLVAEEDRMISPKTQRFMAERMHATVRPHPVDHTPMYSSPAVVTEVILEAARKTLL
jgi:pimeloyl-ACP methyl ester carboxylesterase